MYKTCNYTMSIFYKSISLDKKIQIDKINDLTSAQQIVLKDEIKIALEEMQNMQTKVEKEPKSIHNDIWLHRVNVKINIANQFLRILDLQQDKNQTYKSKYKYKLKQLIENKIGIVAYNNLKQKAHILTMSEIMNEE